MKDVKENSISLPSGYDGFANRWLLSHPRITSTLLRVFRNAFWIITLSLGGLYLATVYASPVNAAGAVIYETATSTNQSTWTDAAGAHGWTFKAPHDFYLCDVSTPVEIFSGSPTGTVSIALHTNANATNTSWSVGSLLATSTGRILSGNTDFQYIDFEFQNCQFLSGASYYFLQIQSDQAVVTPNYYVVGYAVGSTTTQSARSFKGTTLQTNSQWGLKINGLDSLAIFEYPTSTYSGLEFFNDCDGQIFDTYAGVPWFASSSVSYMTCYLFNPASSSVGGLSRWNDALGDFQNTFPFNIYFNFTDAMQTILGEGSTDQPLVLVFPAPFNKTITISSTTLNYSSTATDALNTMKTIMGYAIWLAVGAAIIATIKIGKQ